MEKLARNGRVVVPSSELQRGFRIEAFNGTDCLNISRRSFLLLPTWSIKRIQNLDKTEKVPFKRIHDVEQQLG